MRLLLGLCLALALWGAGGEAIALAQPIVTQSQGQIIAQRTVSPAKTVPPTEVLSRLFTEPELQTVWFADSFLAQISLAEISQIIQGIEGSIGTYQSIEDVDNGFVLTFERGTVATHLAANTQGQITGLLFETPQLSAVSLEDALAALKALPGKIHVLATRDGEEVAALNSNEALAVGSTFKLIILQALREQIAADRHQWDEVVEIRDEWKSLPSGFLQSWPEGSRLTIESLATLMISQSDNTATDHLLHIVGREAVEALSERNQPFLTTREAFVLKDPANISVLRRWRRSREKRTFLSALAALPLPSVGIFNSGPQAIDIEWFFTANELCDAMGSVADLPLMSVNPGLIDPSEWANVSFKGGSEPGAENFTTHLTDKQGHSFCVTATWNNEQGIDELLFSTLYRSLVESIGSD